MSASQTGPRGVFAAVLTPLTPTLAPDLPRLLAHCRWLLDNGCDGLAPLGTTSEANSLPLHQRLALVEALGGSDLPHGRIVVGTGACALADAVALCRTAVDAGLAGQLILPPFYYKNPGEEGLFAFFSEVVERVGDPRLRLYLYHFPQMSAVPIPFGLVERLLARYGQVIAGLKDSSGDWSYTETLLKAHPGLGVFSGSESFLLANLRAGGPGCISATTNTSAALCQRLYRHWREDHAEELQREVSELRAAFDAYPAIAAQKAVKARLTGDPAWLRVLPPLLPLAEDRAEALWVALSGLPQARSILERADLKA